MVNELSNMALRHLWIVSVALLSASCRSENRASLEWRLELNFRYRTTRSRSTLKDSSACQWRLWPTPRVRTAWKSMPNPCLWTLAADDRWTDYSLQVLPPVFQLLAQQLEPTLGWREAKWWMVNRTVVRMMLTMESMELLPVVKSVHQLLALQKGCLFMMGW